MTQRAFLPLLLITNFAALLWAQDKPNVLFIAIDDLVPALGVYGDPYALTPAIDGVASQGTTFLNSHCQWPVCGPSRASLSTGLMPDETGVLGFKPMRAILPDVITLPQHFRNNGYETANTGKFHDFRTVGTIVDPDASTENGADVDDVASWSIPYVKAAGGPNLSGKPATDFSLTLATQEQHGDYQILQEGLTLLNTLAAGNKPFFLAVGFKKPHLPFVAPVEYWNLYDRNSFALASVTGDPLDSSSYVSTMLDFNNELLGYDDITTIPPTEAKQRELIHGYYACVSYVDYLVEQLVDELALLGDPVQAGKMLDETTIIVIWGDHGFHLGDHDRWAKHSLMQRSTFCPLIIYDPRNPTAGAKTNSPASAIDVYPTLCELAELPIPEQPLSDTVLTGRPLRGKSLVPILNDPEASVQTGSITQIQYSGAHGFSYRTERFRYMEWIDSSNTVVGSDLYDYIADPLETTNLAANPEYAEIIFQLSRQMRADTVSQGTERLHNSPPVAASGDGLVLGTELASVDTVAGTLELVWPSSEVSSYNVLERSSLNSGTWVPAATGVAGGSATVSMSGSQGFFAVELGSNDQPYFLSEYLHIADATTGSSYNTSIAGKADDLNVGDMLSFSLVDASSWLSLSSTGTLSGTPTLADLGTQVLTVSVSDGNGGSDTAELVVTVVEAGAGTVSTFTVTDDTFSKETSTTLIAGNRTKLELRQIGANSGFGRASFLKFTVSGIGTVSEVKLWLHSLDESDVVNAHAVADTNWTESSLNWSNQPPLGSVIGSAQAVSGEWFSIDITGAITANGTYAIGLDEQGNSYGNLDSSDAGFAPYLEITWQ